ncbi:MAG TPA: 6-bladed beta-propeller [Saprospiraceae bacterium]|nr:6-bladed beta-propeller [Saprospiraceae bacterium]
MYHFFIACAPDARERELAGTRVINPPTAIIESLYGDITDIQYIPLRPDAKAYPSGIRQLLYHKQYFIMLCYQRGAIYFYDHSGVFQFMVSPTGAGPLEFASAQDIALYDNNTLLICDNTLSKILRFDIVSQQITEDWRVSSPPFSIICHRNYIYMICNDPEGSIKMVKDFNFDQVQSFVKPGPLFNLIASPKPFQIYQDTVFINVGFTDTIYYATPQGLIQAFAAIGQGESALSGAAVADVQNAIFARDAASTNRLQNRLVPSGFLSSVGNKWIIPLFIDLNYIIYDKTNNIPAIASRNALPEALLLSTAPFPMIYNQDAEGYLYSTLLPTPSFYEKLLKLPADAPIRKAAEQGLGIFFQNDTFENPVIVKWRPGNRFLLPKPN